MALFQNFTIVQTYPCLESSAPKKYHLIPLYGSHSHSLVLKPVRPLLNLQMIDVGSSAWSASQPGQPANPARVLRWSQSALLCGELTFKIVCVQQSPIIVWIITVWLFFPGLSSHPTTVLQAFSAHRVLSSPNSCGTLCAPPQMGCL